jgi:hypothetical protein
MAKVCLLSGTDRETRRARRSLGDWFGFLCFDFFSFLFFPFLFLYILIGIGLGGLFLLLN